MDRNPENCWLTGSYLLAFTLPVTATILFNMLVFVRVFTVGEEYTLYCTMNRYASFLKKRYQTVVIRRADV